MNLYSRRRFLSDLLVVGGVITVAAGLAMAGQEPAQVAERPVPQTAPASPSNSPTPEQTPCPYPMPGEVQMATPPPRPVTPTPRPATAGKRAPALRTTPAPRSYRMSGDVEVSSSRGTVDKHNHGKP